MQQYSVRLLRRIALHAVVGALLGYAMLHPIAMLIVHGAAGRFDVLAIRASFDTAHLPMALYFSALASAAGGLQGAYVHRLQEVMARLRALSRTDPLTSLNNRRSLFEGLERELGRARKRKANLALLMLDVDYFKRVNDRHGHPAGDRVLRQIAQLVRLYTRTEDIVARYGGEEFVVLAPGLGVAEASALGERLRAAVEAHEFCVRESETALRVTISVGVATYPSDGTSADALVNVADLGLLSAKGAGRNSVRPASLNSPGGDAIRAAMDDS